eukprot:GHVO01023404.1.p1 GENE.GHVO01023404.1~~GHVO01023404.1.p1  ORF type:complete len:198 (-),score=48.13 GHVO01023404.1:75-668(-)
MGEYEMVSSCIANDTDRAVAVWMMSMGVVRAPSHPYITLSLSMSKEGKQPPPPTSTADPLNFCTKITRTITTPLLIFIEAIPNAWALYGNTTPPTVKALDAYVCILLLIAAIQLSYCMIFGTFPFNSFIAGFLSAIGQATLTICFRIQRFGTDVDATRRGGGGVSPYAPSPQDEEPEMTVRKSSKNRERSIIEFMIC